MIFKIYKMALPTMRPHWITNFRRETSFANKNQDQSDLRKKWDNNDAYFKKSSLWAEKENTWTSEQSFQRSMSAAKNCWKNFSKKDEICKRREKLSEMLIKENKEFEQAMREIRLSGVGRMFELQEKVQTMRSDKEARRKEIADEKLYEKWKRDEPQLREAGIQSRQREAIECWTEQVNEQEEIKRMNQENDEEIEQQMEDIRQRSLLEEQRKLQKRQEMNLEFAMILKQQIEDLRSKEKEAAMLRSEQERLEQQQKLIEEVEEKRKQFEDQRKKQELGRVLIRQYKAQLKRKSRQVQERLEFDLKLLEKLAHEERVEKDKQVAVRNAAKSDAEYMRKVIADQLRLEKEREEEMTMLYQEEAAKQWMKREAEWERERIARERLMKVVFAERQDQIAEKMQLVQERQEESLEEREQLIADMEDYRKQLRENKRKEEEAKKETERLRMAEIDAKTARLKEMSEKDAYEFLQEKQNEAAYQKLLAKESEALSRRQSAAPTHRRRKFAFE